ncbi:hypothetical protein CTAYLR_006982 [Chrysophaeum taylorii]|uniref:PDZ domain-containing protein n=1 Tax=Chrysophaeum taylorii TaxID=2483200 RepID=A0AAD7U9W4_9STRA|nr:hypothetical protein CTAYLR_006982 [Chrysophaeum taylorii]
MVVLVAVLACSATTAFLVPSAPAASSTRLQSWQPNEDYNTFGGSSGRLTDFEREARDAGATDRKVTIRKPLGLVLEANDKGDVYVKEVVKGGNADAIGGVKKGDIISMCSATFGTAMWSTRGAGLDRVMRAIEVRAGSSVSLVVQSKSEQQNILSGLFKNQEKVREARVADAAKKRADLEAEIVAERKEAAKGWFGLF